MNDSRLSYSTATGTTPVSHLSKHLADVTPDVPAKIRRPQVAKHAFSRTAAQARREDGVDTTVVTRRMGTPVPVMTLGEFPATPEHHGWSTHHASPTH